MVDLLHCVHFRLAFLQTTSLPKRVYYKRKEYVPKGFRFVPSSVDPFRASVVQLDAPLTGYQEVTVSILARSGNIFAVEVDHEIFTMVILSLRLVQEGQLLISGERLCTITG